MTEEGDVIRVMAFLVLGQVDEAHLAGEAFLRAHPTSVYAARVKASLANL